MPTPGALRLAAARSALNLLRSRRRRIARELTDYRLADASLSTGRTNGEPFAALDRAARATLVRAALLRLRPRDAELLVLRYGGASYRDAALTLGIDAAQVGTRLVRAERAFRTEIERAATS
jgi:DNA-directed RNA polymerase specialized sigma24 family protein